MENLSNFTKNLEKLVLSGDMPFEEASTILEVVLVKSALEQTKSVTSAAQLLGIKRTTLCEKRCRALKYLEERS